jgi:uncharacterized OB-fold protein
MDFLEDLFDFGGRKRGHGHRVRKCNSCGGEISPQAKFCGSCGTKVAS